MDAFEKLRKQIDAHKENIGMSVDDIDRVFAEAFSTHIGKQALKLMSELWLDTQLFVPGDSHVTAYNLGHADLINYFKDCVKQGVVSDPEGVDNV